MKKKENPINQVNSMLDVTLKERERMEKEENRPLFLYFGGSYSHEVEIPIIKRITPYLVDTVDPIILSKADMRKALLEDLTAHGIKGLLSIESFRNDVYKPCEGCTNQECPECDKEDDSLEAFGDHIGRECVLVYEKEELPEGLTYNKAEFDLLVKHGVNKPQIKEDYRITIEILKMIIDKVNLKPVNSKIAVQMKEDSWDVDNKLAGEYDSEFWQNQDKKEITRIVSRFREDAER